MRHSLTRNSIVISLILFLTLLFCSIESVAQIKLAWDPNIEPDLAGYKVYYGTASRTYRTPINVGKVTTYTLNGLSPAVVYYVAVTAYDTANHESAYSNEVSGQIPETVSIPTALGGPTSGITGTSNTYTVGGSSSNLNHSVQFQFDWKGDATDLSPWGSASQSKTWTVAGTYKVRARAQCATHTSVVSGWSGSLSVTINVPVAAVSCTVTTNPSGLQVTVDGSPYTTPRGFSWVPGSSHILSVSSPQPGTSGVRYVFASWSDQGGQNHTITGPSLSKTYTANLTTQYSLSTSVNLAGGGTVVPSGTSWYNNGLSVSVFARTNPGYSFSGWTGNLSGSTNPGSITMSGPKSIGANFTQNQYTLAVILNPSGSGSVTRSPNKSTYVYGDVVTLTAAPSSGYTFNNWSGDLSATTNPVILKIDGNKTVTANFALGAKSADASSLLSKISFPPRS